MNFFLNVFEMCLKEFIEFAKRMSSGNEFHSTGPAQEMDRRPYSSTLWRGDQTEGPYNLILQAIIKLAILK